MMVMKMIAVLTIIPYQTDEKSIITGRQEIIIYVALKYLALSLVKETFY